MDIVHVDPGYGIFKNSTYVPPYVENDTINPTSSFAFHPNGTQLLRGAFPNLDFTFTPTAGRLLKKVWSVKATVYYSGSGSVALGFSKDAVISSSINVGVKFDSGKATFYYYNPSNGSRTNEQADMEITAGSYNLSVTYSITADGTNSYNKTNIIYIGATQKYATHDYTNLSEIPKNLLLQMNANANNYVSNILVGQDSYDGDSNGPAPSDEGIPYNTPIYRLPLGNPVTNFTTGENGEYVGTANGQTLLQTINTSGLSASLRNANINRIVAYGYPGYCVGSAVTSATGISKSGSTVTAHGTHALSEMPTSYVCDIWAIEEDSTLSDINGLQVGWRAGN